MVCVFFRMRIEQEKEEDNFVYLRWKCHAYPDKTNIWGGQCVIHLNDPVYIYAVQMKKIMMAMFEHYHVVETLPNPEVDMERFEQHKKFWSDKSDESWIYPPSYAKKVATFEGKPLTITKTWQVFGYISDNEIVKHLKEVFPNIIFVTNVEYLDRHEKYLEIFPHAYMIS